MEPLIQEIQQQLEWKTQQKIKLWNLHKSCNNAKFLSKFSENKALIPLTMCYNLIYSNFFHSKCYENREKSWGDHGEKSWNGLRKCRRLLFWTPWKASCSMTGCPSWFEIMDPGPLKNVMCNDDLRVTESFSHALFLVLGPWWPTYQAW